MLNRIARQMPDDGFLVLGAAETVVGLTDAFKPLADKRGLYVPNWRRSPIAGRQRDPFRGRKRRGGDYSPPVNIILFLCRFGSSRGRIM